MKIAKLIKALLCAAVLLASGQALADTLQDILNNGKVRVGLAAYAPWAMRSKKGELIGFDVEVANKLAADMKVEADLKVLPWTDVIDALNSGKVDVIIAGMAITPERALQVNFSNPYARSGVALATNTALTEGIAELRGLNDPKVVVVAAAKTLGSDLAKLMFDKSDLRIVASGEEATQMVLDGKAHAYVGSTVETGFLALEHPDKVDLPLNKPLLASVSGMAVKKGEQEWLNFLNAWVAARSADRWLQAAQKYWFETLKWRDRVQP
jgi:polar amino acid transport system substrate-binding protein